MPIRIRHRYAASTLSGRLCAKACSHTSLGNVFATDSARQSRKVERKPCTVISFRPMRRRTAVRLMCENAAPLRRPGKIGPSVRCTLLSKTKVDVDRGTRCSRPAFIRSAGMVHTASSRLTSDQVAPRTSPDRVAVRIANSTARAASHLLAQLGDERLQYLPRQGGVVYNF
jgi:hypothetical protein